LTHNRQSTALALTTKLEATKRNAKKHAKMLTPRQTNWPQLRYTHKNPNAKSMSTGHSSLLRQLCIITKQYSKHRAVLIIFPLILQWQWQRKFI